MLLVYCTLHKRYVKSNVFYARQSIDPDISCDVTQRQLTLDDFIVKVFAYLRTCILWKEGYPE